MADGERKSVMNPHTTSCQCPECAEDTTLFEL